MRATDFPRNKSASFSRLWQPLGQRGSPEHNLPRIGHIGSQETSAAAKTDHGARLSVPVVLIQLARDRDGPTPHLLERELLLIRKVARAAPPGDYFGQLRYRPLGERHNI